MQQRMRQTQQPAHVMACQAVYQPAASARRGVSCPTPPSALSAPLGPPVPEQPRRRRSASPATLQQQQGRRLAQPALKTATKRKRGGRGASSAPRTRSHILRGPAGEPCCAALCCAVLCCAVVCCPALPHVAGRLGCLLRPRLHAARILDTFAPSGAACQPGLPPPCRLPATHLPGPAHCLPSHNPAPCSPGPSSCLACYYGEPRVVVGAMDGQKGFWQPWMPAEPAPPYQGELNYLLQFVPHQWLVSGLCAWELMLPVPRCCFAFLAA